MSESMRGVEAMAGGEETVACLMQRVMGRVKEAVKRERAMANNGRLVTFRGIDQRRMYTKGNENQVSHC